MTTCQKHLTNKLSQTQNMNSLNVAFSEINILGAHFILATY